jgi:hypothetical protein
VHEIITLRHDDTSVAFDTTAATWSLTDLWRAAGSPEHRTPYDWARFEGKRYLETLAATLHVIPIRDRNCDFDLPADAVYCDTIS